MAANSVREQLILNVISTLSTLDSISAVARKKLEFDEMESVAETQLPYVAVTAGLPLPKYKLDTRRSHEVGAVLSDIDIGLTVYGLDRESPDSAISSLLDDIWAKLYVDGSRGGLAIRTLLYPEAEMGIFDPYYAFGVTCTITYKHSVSGI